MPEELLRDSVGIDVVVDPDGHPGRGLDQRRDRHIVPPKAMGFHTNASVAVDEAGKAESYPDQFGPAFLRIRHETLATFIGSPKMN